MTYIVTTISNEMLETGDKSALDRLYDLAESQAGFFTSEQAVAAGVSHQLLSHHSEEGGALLRAGRGLYRLRNFPAAPNEDLVAAWLQVGEPIDAVVSHQSALELHELSDIVPDALHLTAARKHRSKRSYGRAKLHFVGEGVPENDRARIGPLPVTSVERTLLDAFASLGLTEQSELATAQALERGLTTINRLRRRSRAGSRADQDRVDRVLARIGR